MPLKAASITAAPGSSTFPSRLASIRLPPLASHALIRSAAWPAAVGEPRMDRLARRAGGGGGGRPARQYLVDHRPKLDRADVLGRSTVHHRGDVLDADSPREAVEHLDSLDGPVGVDVVAVH